MTKVMKQDLGDAGQGLFVEKGMLAELLGIVVRNIPEEEIQLNKKWMAQGWKYLNMDLMLKI